MVLLLNIILYLSTYISYATIILSYQPTYQSIIIPIIYSKIDVSVTVILSQIIINYINLVKPIFKKKCKLLV